MWFDITKFGNGNVYSPFIILTFTDNFLAISHRTEFGEFDSDRAFCCRVKSVSECSSDDELCKFLINSHSRE